MSKKAATPATPKLWDDLDLRPYLGEIARRHGVIETIALPSLRDLPPIRIETLFVQPLLAEIPVSADNDPATWPQGQSLLEALQATPQLVVLGDPGGGKTTLANWLAWRLSAGLTQALPPVLEDRVPLPCVLRDMAPATFAPESTLSDLSGHILKRLMGERADKVLADKLKDRIAIGDYALILDGVDEIPLAHRQVVAGWVRQAANQGAVVLATSRIVGYEDWPIDRESPQLRSLALGERAAEVVKLGLRAIMPDFPAELSGLAQRSAAEVIKRAGMAGAFDDKVFGLEKTKSEQGPSATAWAQRRYLMPFDQRRIKAFAENWYRQRTGSEAEARQKAADLLASLAQSEVTRQLARTPNLLNLMAIVHRERAHLPNGKALLYEEIANAYINTIDSQRKITQGDALAPYTWKERKAWLAYIGFQMQLRRRLVDEHPDEDGEAKPEDDGGVLADEQDVLRWLTEAMAASGVPETAATARTYLHWVARRSGLLLPRGEGRYAFVHLSFQEYFCACHLFDRVISPAYVRDRLPEDAPVTRPRLREWSQSVLWRETLVYLFELLSAERSADWVEDLAETLFGGLDKKSDLDDDQANLAAQALVDQHIRLGTPWKDSLADRCASSAWDEWQMGTHLEPGIFQALLEAGYGAWIPKAMSPEEGLPPYRSTRSLQAISPIAKLRFLVIEDETFADIAPLAGLGNLEFLSLNNTPVADVSPLAGLSNLESLSLNNTPVADVSPLAGLSNLEFLSLNNAPVADVSPLAGLSHLESLYLSNTPVADVSPLAGLGNLMLLHLANTPVADVSPLAGLSHLESLYLSNTPVADVSPLAGLGNLVLLHLANTPVADVSPLAGLGNLILLHLDNTPVADVSPLAGLGNLQWLLLANTPVADVSPLAGIPNLMIRMGGKTIRAKNIKRPSTKKTGRKAGSGKSTLTAK